jgi:hypothetical protein
VVIIYSLQPLVATKRVALELLHLQATSKSFPMIIDELDENGSGIRNEFLKLLLNLYPLEARERENEEMVSTNMGLAPKYC